MFTEREQIINYLLQACDTKNQTISGLQAIIAALEKQNEAVKLATPVTSTSPVK